MFFKILIAIIAILNTAFMFAACKVAGEADRRTEMLLAKMTENPKKVD